MDSWTIWVVIISVGIGTYLLRLSFLALIGNRALPSWVIRHLRYTAVAVLPALVIPMIVWSDTKAGSEVSIVQIIAALAALVLGWWRSSVLVAIFAGMGVYYVLNYVM